MLVSSVLQIRFCCFIYKIKYFNAFLSLYDVVRLLRTIFQDDGDMPDKSTKFCSGFLQGPSYDFERGDKRSNHSEASMNSFCDNG